MLPEENRDERRSGSGERNHQNAGLTTAAMLAARSTTGSGSSPVSRSRDMAGKETRHNDSIRIITTVIKR